MATPLAVSTSPIVAIARNLSRVNVQFQNTGNTTLYFARAPIVPTSTNYEFLLSGTGNAANEATLTTNSVSQFNVVSSGANGVLAIFETVKI